MAEMMEDLAAFQTSLEQRFAYLNANGHDYRAAIASIERDNQEGIKSDALAWQLEKVMMGFIDGHAGVSNARSPSSKANLSIRLQDDGDRVVALKTDRTGLMDADHPYLLSIDSVPIEQWIERTSSWIAKGSPQLVRKRGLSKLHGIGRFHEGPLEREYVELELQNGDGSSRRVVRSPLNLDYVRPESPWPVRPEDGILDGNIGYFRLKQMDSRAVLTIKEWMPKFKETIGLIVDVRGNGGGTRTPILELAGYLMGSGDEPRIGNVAKYRLAEDRDRDHLSRARYVYRIDSTRFDSRERAAISKFAATFVPEWEPPQEEFSEWHYLLLSKSTDDTRYHYQAPVVILMDTECFSATDIFLSTFKGWPNVTLVGQPSAGGSARTQSFRIAQFGYLGLLCIDGVIPANWSAL